MGTDISERETSEKPKLSRLRCTKRVVNKGDRNLTTAKAYNYTVVLILLVIEILTCLLRNYMTQLLFV